MNLGTAKNYYITRSRMIFSATEALSQDHYGMFEVFSSRKLKKAKYRLGEYYVWLEESDAVYTDHLDMSGAISDLNIRNAQLGVVERARDVFLSSLNGYEKELSNIQACTNFKISTCLALFAVVIAIAGVAIAGVCTS
jgi:hypothetical protein